LEFANLSPLPVKMYVGEGCCQILFYRGNPCQTSYADRGGKYQNQEADAVISKV
jgi:dCTP deaminase